MEGQQNNPNMPRESSGSAGPVIGIVVILVIVILGALYFWNQSRTNDAALESIQTQNESDEANSIEADLDATNVDNLDAEINAS